MEVKFVNGIRAYKPNEKAPVFIKSNLVINKQELSEWLVNQPDEIKVDLKESKKGSLYLSVNEWKPTNTTYNETTASTQSNQTQDTNEPYNEDLPF